MERRGGGGDDAGSGRPGIPARSSGLHHIIHTAQQWSGEWADPAQHSPVQPSSAQSGPAHLSRAQPSPAQPSPAKPSPPHSSPALSAAQSRVQSSSFRSGPVPLLSSPFAPPLPALPCPAPSRPTQSSAYYSGLATLAGESRNDWDSEVAEMSDIMPEALPETNGNPSRKLDQLPLTVRSYLSGGCDIHGWADILRP